MANEMILLTNLRTHPQGVHDSSRVYAPLDLVCSTDGTAAYIAVAEVPVGIALTNTAYWQPHTDISDVGRAARQVANDMQNVVETLNKTAAEGSAIVTNYAAELSKRVLGEIGKAEHGASFLADAGSLLQPVTKFKPKQEGGTPYPAGGGLNIIPFTNHSNTYGGVTVTVQDDGRLYIRGTATGERFQYNLYGGWKENTGITFEVGNKYTVKTGVANLDAIAYGYNSSGTYTMIPSNALPEDYTDVHVYLQVALGNTVEGYFTPTLTSEGWSDVYIPYENVVPIAAYNHLNLYVNEEIHSTQFHQPVYGGRFDWQNGKIQSQWAIYTLTGNENWEHTADSDIWRFGCGVLEGGVVDPSAGLDPTMYKSTHFEALAKATDATNGAGFFVYDSGYMAFRYDAVTTVAAWKAYLSAQLAAGTPVQVAYKLAETDETNGTAVLIRAADPEQLNTITGDGTITTQYVKPLHVSIEERVAAAIAAMNS